MTGDARREPGAVGIGREMAAWIERLYPLCRSLTGEGVRETLRRLGELAPIELTEIPTGTRVLDWVVPREWNLREAWIRGPAGKEIVHTRDSNLHVVGYSVPVRARLPLARLKPRLHSLPDRPDWIPYRTGYHRDDWGFCLPHRLLESLPEGEYEVCVDATLEDGSMTLGECVLPGATSGEILLVAHTCHPSLANDNLSGLVAAAFLARELGRARLRHTVRFLFAPGTVGSIAWLARNRDRTDRIRHGLTLACLGDAGDPTYKRSRRGDAPVDRAAAAALRDRGRPFRVVEFSPYGYDERQFNSPGFDLPVGCLMRSMYGTFPEYHTSADNLAFVRPEALADSLALLREIVGILERDRVMTNLSPYGEPHLGRRGLYDSLGGRNDARQAQLALLWVLNLSDGSRSLLDISNRSGLPFRAIHEAADALERAGLLREEKAARDGSQEA